MYCSLYSVLQLYVVLHTGAVSVVSHSILWIRNLCYPSPSSFPLRLRPAMLATILVCAPLPRTIPYPYPDGRSHIGRGPGPSASRFDFRFYRYFRNVQRAKICKFRTPCPNARALRLIDIRLTIRSDLNLSLTTHTVNTPLRSPHSIDRSHPAGRPCKITGEPSGERERVASTDSQCGFKRARAEP